MRRLLIGLAGVLMTGAVAFVPSVAHAETTLCVGTSVKSTMKCDPGWAVNMMFMHWRMYRGHNCTNYVAWRLGRDGVEEPKYLLGNAVSWAGNAKKHGVKVDSTPQVGAVGAWSGRNHIVYVEEVRSGSLVLSEDSYSLKRYRRYIAFKGESGYPKTFIHFQGKDAIRGATPTVSGRLEVGETLTAKVGSWSPSGVKLSLQWLRDGVVIKGATSKTYRLVKADAGHRMSISVTGTHKGKLPRTASSVQTDPVSAGTIVPGTARISGTPVEGQKLTAVSTGWTPSDIAVNYQWFADDKAIKDATKSTFTPTSKERGKALVVRVTAYGPGYKAVPVRSAPTAKVAKPGSTPGPVAGAIQPGTARISGVPIEGQTLTASSTGWKPADIGVNYQWFADDEPIKDAAKRAFTLTSKQRGKRIVVRATAFGPGYKAVPVRSAPTAKVVKKGATVGPVTAGTPTITGPGTYMVGDKLTAVPGTWEPAPVATTVQWMRNDKAIKNATGLTYKVTDADVGKSLRVSVTGTRTSFTSVRASSAPTPTIKPRRLEVVTEPTVAGEALVGKTLTVTPGTWSPSGVKTAIQWKRDGKAIADQRATTYVLTETDAKHVISATVTARQDGFDDVTRELTVGPVKATPTFKTEWVDSDKKRTKVLKVSAKAFGRPVAGKARITEEGKTLEVVQLFKGKPALFRYTSKSGRHTLTLTFEGEDWLTRVAETVTVKLP